METHLQYYSHGKLLISGEYFVLDGAMALALPTRLGQSMEEELLNGGPYLIRWKSLDQHGKPWMDVIFNKLDLSLNYLSVGNDPEVASLQEILLAAREKQPDFLTSDDSLQLTSRLEFDRTWGLGSSSTLINNIAQWANIDAYALLEKTFGGSGYDLACANADGPIIYQKDNTGCTDALLVGWPQFEDQLYFVYLGKKQSSREGIAHYQKMKAANARTIDEISKLTEEMAIATTLALFDPLVKEHEQIIAEALGLPKVQDQYFSDYWGTVKSLGAWGGDFVMATSARSAEETRSYFAENGFDTFFSYKDLIFDP